MTKLLNENKDPARIEKILSSIQPEPGKHYYDRMSSMPWNTKKPSPFTSYGKQLGWNALLVVLILAALFVFLTPAGHAIAYEVVQFFARAESNIVPDPGQKIPSPVATRTPEPMTGLALVSAETMPTPTAFGNALRPMSVLPEGSIRMTLDEVENASGMNLYEPYMLPRDYRLTDVVYSESKGMVCLFYRSPQAGSNEFFSICQGKDFQPIPIGASADLFTFQIGAYHVELVQGGWYTHDGSSSNEWSNLPETYTIRWDTEDRSIEMFFMLNESFSPAYISRDEMITLAESMILCPTTEKTACVGSHVVPTRQPMPQGVDDRLAYLNLTDVEPLTGFDILEPGLLPEGLSFSHARFSSSGKFLWLEYGAFAPDLMHANGPSLRISQGLLPDFKANGEDYPPEAIDLVEINGFAGKVYHGSLETQAVSSGQTDPTPTWNRDSGSIQVYWETGTMWYSIWFYPGSNGGERLSKESIVRIAESLH